MGALGGYMNYAASNAIQEVLGEGKVEGDLTTYKTMANNYDKSFTEEYEDIRLCEDYRNEMNVYEGKRGINTITTRAGKYGMTADGDYVNLKSRSVVMGYWNPKSGSIHIAPAYSAEKNLTDFRASQDMNIYMLITIFITIRIRSKRNELLTSTLIMFIIMQV